MIERVYDEFTKNIDQYNHKNISILVQKTKDHASIFDVLDSIIKRTLEIRHLPCMIANDYSKFNIREEN